MAGPPKVTCSICNETVLKSQTYHIGDGKRACKKHEGVIEKSQELQKKEKLDAERIAQLKKQKVKESQMPFIKTIETAIGEVAVHKCYICETEGIMLRDVYMLALIGMKRMELKGKPLNIFNMLEGIKEEKMIDGNYVGLNIISIKEEKVELISKVVVPKFQPFIPSFRFIVSCKGCADRFKLQFEPKIEPISIEQMLSIGSAVDGVVEDIAKKSIEKEKEN